MVKAIRCNVVQYNPYSLDIPDAEEVLPCPYRKNGICTYEGDLEFQFNWSGVFWCETRSKAVTEEIRRRWEKEWS